MLTSNNSNLKILFHDLTPYIQTFVLIQQIPDLLDTKWQIAKLANLEKLQYR